MRTPSGKVGNFVAVRLQIYFSIYAKNYQTAMLFDKVISKIKRCDFCLTMYVATDTLL